MKPILPRGLSDEDLTHIYGPLPFADDFLCRHCGTDHWRADRCPADSIEPPTAEEVERWMLENCG